MVKTSQTKPQPRPECSWNESGPKPGLNTLQVYSDHHQQTHGAIRQEMRGSKSTIYSEWYHCVTVKSSIYEVLISDADWPVLPQSLLSGVCLCRRRSLCRLNIHCAAQMCPCQEPYSENCNTLQTCLMIVVSFTSSQPSFTKTVQF